MSDQIFLDTNLWVYLYTKDPAKKSTVVARLIANQGQTLIVSTQILGELYNVLTRKKLFTKPETAAIIRQITLTFPVRAIDTAKVLMALEISDRYGFSYWDSLVVATALLEDCRILYSEDMHHEQMVEGKTQIINPLLENSLNDFA